jgi:hypothetical protein
MYSLFNILSLEGLAASSGIVRQTFTPAIFILHLEAAKAAG